MTKLFVQRALSLAVAALLSACAFSPDQTLPTPAVPEVYTQQLVEVDSAWWKAFADPTLDKLIDEALTNSPSALAAMAAVDEARAVYGVTSAAQLPQLGVTGSAGRQERSEAVYGAPQSPIGGYELGLVVNWELDLWGRVRNLSDAAKRDYLASEYNYAATRTALAAEVAAQYFNLQALDAQLRVAKQTVDSRRGAYELRDKRFKGGLTSELDVRQAEAELKSAEAAVPNLLQRQVQTESALAVLVGVAPRTLIESGVEREEGKILQVPVPAALPSDLLLRRPDVRATEQQLIGARARIGAARAAYFPKITLTGLLGTQTTAFDDLFGSGSRAWSFVGNLAMPLFDNGLTAAQVDQARAREKAAVAAYQKAVITAFAETREGIVSLEQTRIRTQALAQQTAALKRQLYLAQLRYDNGYSSYLEVLDAERSLFTEELNLISAYRDQHLAVVALYKALGGGWTPPEQQEQQ
ncbi:efflux transporter outer membrane subunit [Chitinibacteraceae bacterium HSL-7]